MYEIIGRDMHRDEYAVLNTHDFSIQFASGFVAEQRLAGNFEGRAEYIWQENLPAERLASNLKALTRGATYLYFDKEFTELDDSDSLRFLLVTKERVDVLDILPEKLYTFLKENAEPLGIHAEVLNAELHFELMPDMNLKGVLNPIK